MMKFKKNNQERKARREKASKKKKVKKLTILFIALDVIAIMCYLVMYGPWSWIRNTYVLTAMNTMNHQWMAKIFFSDKTIDNIINGSYFIPLTGEVDKDAIIFDPNPKTTYKDEYEKAILERDPGNDLYKIIDIKLNALTSAKIVAIYDPTKIKLIRKAELGTTHGEKLTSLCKKQQEKGNKFEVGINGGRFEDITGYGSGIPQGYVIENGEIAWTDGPSDTKKGDIIGFTDKGILMLMSGVTGDEALAAGVKEAVEFGPFLIINGQSMKSVGDGFQTSPRTAIAQRKDGVVLFLVVDGELYINGATLQDLVTVLVKYGAYNAANLDGGQSTSLVNNQCKLINSPPSAAKAIGGRGIVTGFALYSN